MKMTTDNGFFVENALLVDDSQADNFLNRMLIEQLGFAKNVQVKNSGMEALSYLHTLDETTDAFPDVIFLDINMPVGNGFDFLKGFAQFSEFIKEKCNIIVLSTSDSPRDLNKLIESPYVKDYVNKPLTRFELEKIKDSISFYLKFR